MHGKRRGLNEVGVMGRVAMKGWAVGCNERQMGGEKQKYDTYINSSSGTENAKKMQLPTCDVAFSPLHFFATLINLCIVLRKKTKKCKKTWNGTKTNATENAKKMQFPTLHFLSCIFFATCDVAFS